MKAVETLRKQTRRLATETFARRPGERTLLVSQSIGLSYTQIRKLPVLEIGNVENAAGDPQFLMGFHGLGGAPLS